MKDAGSKERRTAVKKLLERPGGWRGVGHSLL